MDEPTGPDHEPPPTRTRPLRIWVSEEPVTARVLWRTLVIAIFLEVLLFMLFLGLEVQIVRRNTVLDHQAEIVQGLHVEVNRIDEAVTDTRKLLRDTVAVTPEEQAQRDAVRQALVEIAEIRGLLCQINDPVRQAACAGLNSTASGGP